MDPQKLIARYMIDDYPTTIARVNRWGNERNPCKGWATKYRKYGVEEPMAEADAFVNGNDFALLVGCQFDKGRKVWKAWRAPYLMARSLDLTDSFTAASVLRARDRIEPALRENRLGSAWRGYETSTQNLIALCQSVNSQYGGDAGRIWSEPTTFGELQERIYHLPDFGVGIGNMLIKFLVEFGMIPQIRKTREALSELQLKPDTHVRRVFYRTGLSPTRRDRDVMAAAAAYSSECPLFLDSAGFEIGVSFCFSRGTPNCDGCPVSAKKSGERLCPRRGLYG